MVLLAFEHVAKVYFSEVVGSCSPGACSAVVALPQAQQQQGMSSLGSNTGFFRRLTPYLQTNFYHKVNFCWARSTSSCKSASFGEQRMPADELAQLNSVALPCLMLDKRSGSTIWKDVLLYYYSIFFKLLCLDIVPQCIMFF